MVGWRVFPIGFGGLVAEFGRFESAREWVKDGVLMDHM